jgi:hypothetical protein
MNLNAFRTLAALGIFGAVGSCSLTKPTQLVAGVTTQMQVPKELKTVGIVIQSNGRIVWCEGYAVQDGTVKLPSTLGMEPSGDPSSPITLTVLGFKSDQQQFSSDCLVKIPDVGESDVLVLRRRRTPYITNRVLYLPMPLKRSCAASDKCGPDKTCVGGECVTAEIDPKLLRDYSDILVFGNTGSCFPVARCADAFGALPAKLLDGSKCLFEAQVPTGMQLPDPPGLNVRITYDNFTPEVLDLDPEEGFVVPDPSKPLQFRLASNLCSSNYNKGKIVAVQASPMCPSKTPLQPICDEDIRVLQKGSTDTGNATLCTQEGSLTPAESALLVLMDRSSSMSLYFGASPLKGVLDLSLQDPVFAHTRIGLKFMPAAGCADANFGTWKTVDVPFDLPEKARTAIAGKLGDTTTMLTTNAAVNMGTAMQGAYKLLTDLQPSSPTSVFNRRAVLIVGNRLFNEECPGLAPNTLAQQAFASNPRIYTYVLMVQDPGGSPPTSVASPIALAGGTSLFNATTDPNIGGVALQTVVSDLSSCVYDKSTLIPSKVADTKLSYFDPTLGQPVYIGHNSLCSEGATGQDGWNLDPSGRAIICGASCSSLRNAGKALSLAAAASGSRSPGFRVKVSTPCAP